MCRPLRERARPVTYREPTENEIFRNAAGAAVLEARRGVRVGQDGKYHRDGRQRDRRDQQE